MDEKMFLRAVITQLWHTYLYQQEYASYLLGSHTEAEFHTIAELYATSFATMPAADVRAASSILLNLLGSPLTSSQLSVLLNVDPADIELALATSHLIDTLELQ